MASLWIGPGEGLAIKGFGIEDPDYQVEARFEALNEGVLAAASKLTGYFFAISISQKVRCLIIGFSFIIASQSGSASGYDCPQQNIYFADNYVFDDPVPVKTWCDCGKIFFL